MEETLCSAPWWGGAGFPDVPVVKHEGTRRQVNKRGVPRLSQEHCASGALCLLGPPQKDPGQGQVGAGRRLDQRHAVRPRQWPQGRLR